MLYTFNLCPKCKDKLVEQDIVREEDYKVICCPNCGSEMELALSGEEKAEDTTYKIVLNNVRLLHNRRDKCLKTIMQIGNCNEKEALEKLSAKNSVIFEGDLLNTYLSLRCLDKVGHMVDYTVVPQFPYARTFVQICPQCEEEAVYKKVEVEEDKVKAGCFCEKCNEWIFYDIKDKYEFDETMYHLKISVKEIQGQDKREILRAIDELCNKETEEDQIVIHDLARNIVYLLELLETNYIEYEIEPPYPHKIRTFKKEWTDEDIARLIAANPGLKVTAEEMNAL